MELSEPCDKGIGLAARLFPGRGLIWLQDCLELGLEVLPGVGMGVGNGDTTIKVVDDIEIFDLFETDDSHLMEWEARV